MDAKEQVQLDLNTFSVDILVPVLKDQLEEQVQWLVRKSAELQAQKADRFKIDNYLDVVNSYELSTYLLALIYRLELAAAKSERFITANLMQIELLLQSIEVSLQKTAEALEPIDQAHKQAVTPEDQNKWVALWGTEAERLNAYVQQCADIAIELSAYHKSMTQ